jgi:hypothetical protein
VPPGAADRVRPGGGHVGGNAPQSGDRGVEHALPPLGDRARDGALAVPVPSGRVGHLEGEQAAAFPQPEPAAEQQVRERRVPAVVAAPPRQVRLACRIVAEQRKRCLARAGTCAALSISRPRSARPGAPGQRLSLCRRRAAAPGGPGPGCARCAAPSRPTRRPAGGPPAPAATCRRRSPGPAAGRAAARPPSPAGRPGPPRASTYRAATRTRRTAGSPSRMPASSPRPATRTATGPGTGPAPGRAGIPGRSGSDGPARCPRRPHAGPGRPIRQAPEPGEPEQAVRVMSSTATIPLPPPRLRSRRQPSLAASGFTG